MAYHLPPSPSRPLNPRAWLYPTYHLASVSSLLLPPGAPRILCSAPLFVSLFVEVPRYTTGSPTQDCMLGVNAAVLLLKWIDWVVLRRAEEAVWEVEERGPGPGPKGVEYGNARLKEEVSGHSGGAARGRGPETLWGRFCWGFRLFATNRGVGWNWKVKNVPEAVPLGFSKWKYVRQRLFNFGFSYLVLDALCLYVLQSPYGMQTNRPVLIKDAISTQITMGWVDALRGCYALQLQYHLFSALTTAIGLYKPQMWPPLMGSVRDMYTIRNLWGRVWHQLLRRVLNLPFEILKRFVTIRKGTFASRYLQLHLAFFTSAMVHHAGALNLPSLTWEESKWQFLFFVAQPFGIMAEDFLIYCGKQLGFKESKWTKTVGYLWTLAWFSFTLRFMSSFQMSAGFGAEKVIPSVVKVVLEGMGWKLV